MIVAVAYVGEAGYFIQRSRLNADEGFYALAARNVMEGQIPYRDFAYSQLPVVPYVNGLAMRIVGFGFLEQRGVNAFWGLVTLLVVLGIGYAHDRGEAALWATTLAVASPWWVSFTALGKTYALAGLFLVLAVAVFLSSWPRRLKALGFAVTATLAVGCRLSVIFAVAPLLAAFLATIPTRRERWTALGVCALAMVALFAPFLAAAPEAFLFWNGEYHRGTVIRRDPLTGLMETLMLAPGVLLLLAAATVCWWRRRDSTGTGASGSGIVLAALLGIGGQFILPSPYGENSTPFVALGALGALLEVARASSWARWRPYLPLALLPSLVLLSSGSLPPVRQFLPGAVLSSASYVRHHTPPGGRVLTPVPIVAVEADREVFPGLEMGMFAMTTEIPEGRATRLHLTTPNRLGSLVAARVPVAVVLMEEGSTWNFAWSVPSLRLVSPEVMRIVGEPLTREYELRFRNELFTVWLPKPPR